MINKYNKFVIDYQTQILCFFVSLVSVYAWYNYTYYIDLDTAYKSFSPYEWIVLTDNQNISSLSFPSGLEIYNSVVFFKIYKFFHFFGVDTIVIMKTVIAFELFITYVSVYYFVKILFKDLTVLQSNIIILVVYVYFISSYALFPEISRFGSSFKTGLYYNIANAFRLIALAAFLNKRFLTSGIFLSMSFLIHPVYGMIGGLFLLVSLFVIAKELTKNDFKYIVLAIIVFLSISIFWYFNTFQSTINGSTSIPSDKWYFFALFGNYHWFPIEFGLLGEAHQQRLIGFITISILYLNTLATKPKITTIDKQIFYGWLVLIILTIVGLLISWYKPSPFLTKIALTRASLLAMEIGIVYIVYKFMVDLFDKNIHFIKKALILSLLITPFLIKAPFPLYIVFAMLLFDFKTYKERLNVFSKLTLYLFGLLILSIIYFYSAGYIHIDISRIMLDKYLANSEYDRYVGNVTIFNIAIIFMLLSFVFKRYFNSVSIYSIVLLNLIVFFVIYQVNTMPNEKKILKAKSFKQTQLWANKNTPVNALFMLDSSMNGAWKSYSKRASFGVLREWIHTSWLYAGNYSIFQEGIKRFDEFGIDIKDKRYEIQPRLRHYNRLRKDVRDKFYNFDEKWFKYMSKKYGIGYIVMQKKFIKNKLPFKIVYENKYYLIYKL